MSTATQTEADIFSDWLNGIIAENPSSLYPTPLGQMDIDEYYTILLGTLVNASYVPSDDLTDIAQSNDDKTITAFSLEKYTELLEQMFYSLYEDFNTFVQYSTLSLILRTNSVALRDAINLGVPEKLAKCFVDSGESGLKLLMRAFTQVNNYPSFKIYVSDYNVGAIIKFYNLMPDHVKVLMESDMEEILSELYTVDTV